MKPIIIAVDGFSSSGKSSMAKSLAKAIGYRYVDSGAMYRAITLYCMRNGIIADSKVDINALTQALNQITIDFEIDPTTARQNTLLNGENVEREIRTMDVSNKVSIISAIPQVRHKMVALQQAMGKEKGIVMDGRDIGTTVFPHAEMKIYVNASAETRALRRFNELKEKGESTTYEAVLANIKERDLIDTTRKESPLRMANDAIVLDNSTMTIAEQDTWLLTKFKEITSTL